MTKAYVAKTDVLKDRHFFQQYYQLAPLFRKEKIDRLVNDGAKRLSLAAWMLLAYALEAEGITPEAMHFDRNENGKPFLRERPDVYFNLSHSVDTVFCAVSESEVGCDVQKMRPITPEIADRFFTPAECELLNCQNTQKERTQLFFRLWTLKESFIKMTGQTIAALPDFSIIFGDDKIFARQHFIQNKEFYFKEFSLNDGNCYACCAEQKEFSELRIINFKDIGAVTK